MLCIMGEVDQLVKAIEDTINLRYLADAFGSQLDINGEIVGISRVIPGVSALGYFGFYDETLAARPSIGDVANPTIGGVYLSAGDQVSNDFTMNDTQYKQAIYAKILKNGSACTVDDVIDWIDLMVGFPCDTEIAEGTNVGIITIHETLPQVTRTSLGLFMAFMKPVGTKLTLFDNIGEIPIRPLVRGLNVNW